MTATYVPESPEVIAQIARDLVALSLKALTKSKDKHRERLGERIHWLVTDQPIRAYRVSTVLCQSLAESNVGDVHFVSPGNEIPDSIRQCEDFINHVVEGDHTQAREVFATMVATDDDEACEFVDFLLTFFNQVT